MADLKGMMKESVSFAIASPRNIGYILPVLRDGSASGRLSKRRAGLIFDN
jgi:hypothetical protein